MTPLMIAALRVGEIMTDCSVIAPAPSVSLLAAGAVSYPGGGRVGSFGS
jgi:hypothetical protein